jgi:hypothetical protein
LFGVLEKFYDFYYISNNDDNEGNIVNRSYSELLKREKWVTLASNRAKKDGFPW